MKGPSTAPVEGGRYRARLLALFVLTALFTMGLIFLKIQLEQYRQDVQSRIELTLGARFDVGEVNVHGIRSIQIRDFSAVLEDPNAPTLAVTIPTITLELDLLQLISGAMSIERIHLEGAVVEAARREGQDWLGGYFERYFREAGLGPGMPFRVTGENCSIAIRNLVGDSSVRLSALELDGSRLPDAEDLNLLLRGTLDDSSDKPITLRLRYTTEEDFDLRLVHDRLTAKEINQFLPGAQQFATAGMLSATARVSGYPGPTLALGLEGRFSNLALRDEMPIRPPATGMFSAMGSFDPATDMLTVTAAELRAPEITGTVSGHVSFAESLPTFDLRFGTRNLSATDLLTQYLESVDTPLEGLHVQFEDDPFLEATLTGNVDAPVIGVEGRFRRGTIEIDPPSGALPKVSLQTGLTQFAWNSATGAPRGSMNVEGGVIQHPQSGLEAEQVNGVLHLDGSSLRLEPITANLTGNPVSGYLRYDTTAQEASFQFSGALAGLESIPALQSLEDFQFAGSASLRCTGTVTPTRTLLDLQTDMTQASAGFEWWLAKPMGTGASLSGVHVELIPRRSMKITGNFALDNVQGNAALEFEHGASGWLLNIARAKAAEIPLTTLDRYLLIDYRGLSGALADAALEWRRVGDSAKENTLAIEGRVPHAEILPKDGQASHIIDDAHFRLLMDNATPGAYKAELNLDAGNARLPRFGDTWFASLRPDDPELQALYPPKPRSWNIEIAADQLAIAPWSGSNFSGNVRIADDVISIERFEANVDEGQVEGSYSLEEAENYMTLEARWKQVPASVILRHLELPELLSGMMDGAIAYSIDLDDPGTLEGSGSFDIASGQFSADFLSAMLEERMEANLMTLPPSLRFSRLRSDFALAADKIETSGLLLESEGMTLSGNGHFIVDGDLDYRLDLSITPEAAEQIPVLRDNLNIEGHRISQNNIQLGFHVTGPMFAPTGAVTGLPSVGVTLVSGAFELTSEAIKVIDVPRQILIDLFKIGGGLMGPPR